MKVGWTDPKDGTSLKDETVSGKAILIGEVKNNVHMDFDFDIY
jgi:hypothetical protein